MKRKNTLSLCMIVKNEESNLSRCLSSVKDLVDEIVIVDTGSTDNTLEIANQFNARILTYEWKNDFSVARNYSLKHAACQWILYLDADEELIINDKSKFFELLDENNVEGYYFNIISATSDNPGGQELRHSNLRLFKNNTAYRFSGAIHEQITPSIITYNTNARLVHLNYNIIHYGYKDEILRDKNKNERNLEIIKEQLKKTPDDNYLHYNLAVALYEKNDLSGALQSFEKALNNLDLNTGYAASVYRNYSICLLKNYQVRKAVEIIESGIEKFPDYTDLYYLQAQGLEKLNKISLAQDAYMRCLELGNAPIKYISTVGVGSYLSLYKLGQLMERCGYYNNAAYYYRRTFEINPNHQDSLICLGRSLKELLKDPLKIRAYIQKNIKITSVNQLVQVADLLYTVSDFAGSLSYINKAISETNVKSKEITMLKAKCLFMLKRWEEARLQLMEIAPGSNCYIEAILYSCVCCWLTMPVKNPVQIIKKIKEHDYSMYQVMSLFNQRVILNKTSEQEELDFESLERLIFILLRAEGLDLAKLAVRLSGAEKEGEISYFLGKVLFKKNFYLEAFDYLLNAMEAGLLLDDLYYMLGCICLNKSLLWEAEQFLHQAIEINNSCENYHIKLIEILLQQTGQNILDAIRFFPENQTFKNIFNDVKECRLGLETVRG